MWTPTIDANTWWTTLILISVAYLIGCINFGRIYISIFRKGDASYQKNGETKTLTNFGTSNIAGAFGVKFGIAQFFVDFLKPMLFLLGFALPLILYTDQFVNALLSVAFIGVLLGHNFPVFWKFKGGDGIATGVGILILINPIAGVVGITSWLVLNLIIKNNLASTFWAMVITLVVNSIPSLYYYGQPSISFEQLYWIYISWSYLFVIATSQWLHKGTYTFFKSIFFLNYGK